MGNSVKHLCSMQSISKMTFLPFAFENHSSGPVVQGLFRKYQAKSWELHCCLISFFFFFIVPLYKSATLIINPQWMKRLKHKTALYILALSKWLYTFRWYIKNIWNTCFLLELAETLTAGWTSQIVITSVTKWACCFLGVMGLFIEQGQLKGQHVAVDKLITVNRENSFRDKWK